MDSSKEERHTPKQPDRKDAQRDSKERTRGTRRGGRGRRDEQRARRDRREAQRDRDQPPKRDTQEEQPKEVQRETGDSKERTRGTRRGGRGRRDEQRARRDRREAQRDRDQPPKRDTQEEQPKEVQRETGDSKERTRGTRRGGRGRRDEQRARRDRREAQRDRDQPPKRDTQEEQPKEVQRETGDNAKETLMKEDDEATLSNWDSIWNTISTVNMNSNTSINPDALHERAYAIKSAFLHAWHGYAKHALGHDEIRPVSDLPGDSWGGLGATLIDSLDTLMIMQIKDEFKQAREQLQQVKFDIDLQVSFFETTIRHLGGLIGAYEMSKLLEPEDKFMLQQAISLGDHLLAAFNTKHGIPKSMVNLQSGEIKNYGWTKDRSVLSE
eukprot:163580_1